MHARTSLLPFLAATVLVAGATEAPARRYRVEQIIRLETGAAPGGEKQPHTAVEARLRYVLEQSLDPAHRGRGEWRMSDVEVAPPRAEPPGSAAPGLEAEFAAGLNHLLTSSGPIIKGKPSDLPVLPLGETAPGWLTPWLRFAATGMISPASADPVEFPPSPEPERAVAYSVRWLRTESRGGELCHVQQARWAAPLQPADAVLPAELRAQGVGVRAYFAAQSLEWVSQASGELVRAERSGARETLWRVEPAAPPGGRELLLRLRLGVTVRLERLR